MINELFSFQKQAVSDLRKRAAMALKNYNDTGVPQVISLQAPTGAGKTIIMSSLIEDILFGSENYVEQQDAIFVWLSDSPQLNEQSKQKIEQKADKIRLDQCVVIADESFDQEVLEEGNIYFLNTQKLGKGANLGKHSDSRQYTIWETIENTIKTKSDRMYFIIDEAHRGMQGNDAGRANTIMQRFIKGSEEYNLSPVPVVIGMSATAERFTKLVGNATSSTLHTVVVPAAQVRQSGLLKDRIVITYPEDLTKHSDMAVLQAATDEWQDKCKHWYQYTYEQHYANVNPVFVIQVAAGTGDKVSNTDLDDVIAKIEERTGERFKANEVVHTFGSTGSLEINGLTVPHIEPSEITEDRRIRVVLFKENLSTGWDCPRAETMMSFRKAEDGTYIAQLLGRMVRTPLQCHVLVDDSLNEVRLFLPYFSRESVQKVIDELQATEGGEIPTFVDGESMETPTYEPWSVHTDKKSPKPKKTPTPDEGQLSFFGSDGENTSEPDTSGPQITQPLNDDSSENENTNAAVQNSNGNSSGLKDNNGTTFVSPAPESETVVKQGKETAAQSPYHQTENQDKHPSTEPIQTSLLPTVDREGIIKFINKSGFLNYMVRQVKINNYVKSLVSLAGVLSQFNIYLDAIDDVNDDVVDMIHEHCEKLRKEGKYNSLAKQVMEMKLSIQIYDVFGEVINNSGLTNLSLTSESDLDRQLRAADAQMCNCGFPIKYGTKYYDFNDPNAFKIDCIIFAFDSECRLQLHQYAEKKFHELNDEYRKYMVSKSEKCQKQYSDIVADGDPVSKHNFVLPETISAKIETSGKLYYDHLYANSEGKARIKLNEWELSVLTEEQKRSDFVCWLRNPPRQTWSLQIPYEIDGQIKPMYPDFLIIRKDETLGYIIDILEPHSSAFKDNLAKAKGLAHYAKNEKRIGRIHLIRLDKDLSGNNRFKRLNLSKGEISSRVIAATTNDELDHIFNECGVFED